MIVFNPGSGPRLVVGGRFAQTGTTTVNNVAQWVGGTWVPLSSSPSGVVRARRSTTMERGPALYVGGDFTFAGVVAASHVAKWNGSTWSALGAGVNGNVNAMAVFGGFLYVGGSFTTAGGLPANYVARWNGASWSALGTGIAPVAGGTVNALIAFDSGTGLALHAGGVFVNAGGNAVINVARWSGTAWSAAGNGLNGPVDAFAVFDDGAGVKLYAGGLFATTGGGVTVNNVAKLSGTSWARARDRDGRRGLRARRLRRRQRPSLRRRRVHERGWQRRARATRALGRIRVVERRNVARRGCSSSRARDRRGRDLSLCRRRLHRDWRRHGVARRTVRRRLLGGDEPGHRESQPRGAPAPRRSPSRRSPPEVPHWSMQAVSSARPMEPSSCYMGRFGPYPPSIGHGPAPVSMCAGTAATLSVTVSGATPFTYQWRKNAADIPGATSSSYSIASTSAVDAGAYSVVVTNGCGSATSANAVLTVNSPSITAHPARATVCQGAAASFTVTASGAAPLTYQWRKNAVNIPGATSSSFSIAATSAGDAAAYSVVVTNGCGSVTSADAVLALNTAPSITAQPASATVCEGAAASFSVAATGTDPLTYQWRKNAVNIGGATSSSYSIAATLALDAATYSVVVTNGCGSVTSADAVLTLNAAPSITVQPANATVCQGAVASFAVAASGTAPFTYQWRKDTVNIRGATSSSYSIASASARDVATYSVVVTNGCGAALSFDAVLALNMEPSITAQPASATICEGAAASFSVAASGTAPLTYQWRKNAVNIGGATSSSYSIASASAADTASYDVVVTNGCGSATSAAAVLTVNVPVSFTVQPQSQSACPGSNAVFDVTPSGTSPFSFQWQKDGTPISGAVSSSLVVASVASGDAGAYSVIVSNACGSMTSAAAVLTIDVPGSITITTQPVSATACEGSGTIFSITAWGTSPLGYQWRWNGTPIALATSSTYPIGAATPASAGAYDVIVSGLCNSMVSDPAILTVVPVTPGVTCPSVLAVGTGCGGAGMPAFACSAPVIGQNVTLSLNQATPNAAGSVFYSGVPAAPIPLGFGCIVELDLATYALLLPMAADPTGSWAITLTLPMDPGLVGIQAAMQVALFGTAAPFGIDISNGLIVTIGG